MCGVDVWWMCGVVVCGGVWWCVVVCGRGGREWRGRGGGGGRGEGGVAFNTVQVTNMDQFHNFVL